MVSWASLERKGSSSKELDVDELYDQLSTMGTYIKQLTGAFGKVANRRWGQGWGHARGLVASTAHDAEETINDNLAASLIIAVGLGVLIGYMIRRGSE